MFPIRNSLPLPNLVWQSYLKKVQPVGLPQPLSLSLFSHHRRTPTAAGATTTEDQTNNPKRKYRKIESCPQDTSEVNENTTLPKVDAAMHELIGLDTPNTPTRSTSPMTFEECRKFLSDITMMLRVNDIAPIGCTESLSESDRDNEDNTSANENDNDDDMSSYISLSGDSFKPDLLTYRVSVCQVITTLLSLYDGGTTSLEGKALPDCREVLSYIGSHYEEIKKESTAYFDTDTVCYDKIINYLIKFMKAGAITDISDEEAKGILIILSLAIPGPEAVESVKFLTAKLYLSHQLLLYPEAFNKLLIYILYDNTFSVPQLRDPFLAMVIYEIKKLKRIAFLIEGEQLERYPYFLLKCFIQLIYLGVKLSEEDSQLIKDFTFKFATQLLKSLQNNYLMHFHLSDSTHLSVTDVVHQVLVALNRAIATEAQQLTDEMRTCFLDLAKCHPWGKISEILTLVEISFNQCRQPVLKSDGHVLINMVCKILLRNEFSSVSSLPEHMINIPKKLMLLLMAIQRSPRWSCAIQQLTEKEKGSPILLVTKDSEFTEIWDMSPKIITHILSSMAALFYLSSDITKDHFASLETNLGRLLERLSEIDHLFNDSQKGASIASLGMILKNTRRPFSLHVYEKLDTYLRHFEFPVDPQIDDLSQRSHVIEKMILDGFAMMLANEQAIHFFKKNLEFYSIYSKLPTYLDDENTPRFYQALELYSLMIEKGLKPKKLIKDVFSQYFIYYWCQDVCDFHHFVNQLKRVLDYSGFTLALTTRLGLASLIINNESVFYRYSIEEQGKLVNILESLLGEDNEDNPFLLSGRAILRNVLGGINRYVSRREIIGQKPNGAKR